MKPSKQQFVMNYRFVLKQSWPVMLASLALFSVLFGAFIGWGTYAYNESRSLRDALEEARTVLSATSGYVASYSQQMTMHEKSGSPIPVMFSG